MNTCRECGVELIKDENWLKYQGRRRYNSHICKNCEVKYKKKFKLKKKLKAIEYLGGKCMKCGGVFPSCAFDFHHRDPSEKEIQMSRIKDSAWDRIVKELDKCDLLCANCHRIEHHGTDD